MLSNLAKSLLLFICATSTAMSSVTIMGTRVVFTGNNKDQIIRLNNKDKIEPALVQVWVDDGIKINDINNKNIPFVVTPPVSRLEPLKGQSVRLIYNGMALAQDKETVFYFNLLEIPPEGKASIGPQLDLAFKTRIKLFYRPVGLMKSNSVAELDKLSIDSVSNPQKGTGVKVTNPTPYYFSFSDMDIKLNGKKVGINVDMVAPGASAEFYASSGKAETGTISEINYNLINDYGSLQEVKLTKGAGAGFTAVQK